MRKPSETWVPHPYTCRPHFSFFLHQKHKFGSLNSLRSTNTRHIEIGPNFMLLGPHLYKILPWAAPTFFILVLALGYKSSILKSSISFSKVQFHFEKSSISKSSISISIHKIFILKISFCFWSSIIV